MASGFMSDFFPRRSPPERVGSIDFHLRNIYIVPTLAGLGLLGVVLVTLIAAINFQNSLIYIVCFWLGSLLIINILYTFRNLSGLRVELMGAEPCFAGQTTLVTLRVSSQRPRESIYIGWKGVDLALVGLSQRALTADARVSYPAPRRGRLSPPRLDLFTRYPTGLSLAWAYANLDINAIVYPEPKLMEFSTKTRRGGEMTDDGPAFEGGVSDFYGMRTYQPGDSLRRVHWPQYARTGKLHSKLFVDYQQHDLWLAWEELPAGTAEQRLSHLCARVLELDEKQQTFGLSIPGRTIAPGSGEVHRVRCLTALALHSGEG